MHVREGRARRRGPGLPEDGGVHPLERVRGKEVPERDPASEGDVRVARDVVPAPEADRDGAARGLEGEEGPRDGP